MTENASSKQVAFYDYELKDHNDFILKFQDEGDKNALAVAVVVYIHPKEPRVYDVSKQKWIMESELK